MSDYNTIKWKGNIAFGVHLELCNICRHEYEILAYFPHGRGWFLYVKWNESFEVIIFQMNYVTAHLSSSTTVAVTTAGGGGSPLRVTSPPNFTAGGGASSSSSPLHQVLSVTVLSVETCRKEMQFVFQE